MNSNTLDTKEFNPINGAVPPPIRKATLQKDDKPQLTNNPADKFERTTQALQNQSKPTENPNTLTPWLIAGTSLLISLGTVAMVATQFFKRPAEVPNSLSEASIKPILERLTTLEEAGSGLERKDVEALLETLKQDLQSGNQQKIDDILHQITELENRLKPHITGSGESLPEDLPAIKTKVVSPQSSLDSEEPFTFQYPESTNNKVQQFLDMSGDRGGEKYTLSKNEQTIQALIAARLNYLKENIITTGSFAKIRSALLVICDEESRYKASSSLEYAKTLNLINELIYAENSEASSSIIDASTSFTNSFEEIKTNHPALLKEIQAVITAKGQEVHFFRKAFDNLVTELENIFIQKNASQ